MKKKYINIEMPYLELLETLSRESGRLNKTSKRRKLTKLESEDLIKYLKIAISLKSKDTKNINKYEPEEDPLKHLSNEELNILYRSLKDREG